MLPIWRYFPRTRSLSGFISSLNPAAWFRYGQGITVTGAGVSQWDDQSGNGRHLLQGTDANRPALQADGSILFNGIDEFLMTGALTLAQPATWYFLGKQVTWADAKTITDGGVLNEMRLFSQAGSPTISLFAGTATAASNNNLIVDTNAVVSYVFNGANSLIQVNNTTPTTGNPGAASATAITLGANGGGGAGFKNIQCKELLVFPVAHDAATRAGVIQYLAQVGNLSL